MNAGDILRRLQGVRSVRGGWTANCPAHPDHKPSLSVNEEGDKILLFCHAGCTLKEICAALGIAERDLFNDKPQHTRAKISPVERIVTTTDHPREVAHYDYTDESGNLLFQTVRYEPKDFRQRKPDGKGWAWNLNGTRRVLYRLPEVLASGDVIITEGEKDVEAARVWGLVATCNPMGAGKWREEYAESLKGKRVAVIADADEPGRKHAEQVATSLYLRAASVKVLELPGAKDLHEWATSKNGTRDALLELIRNTPVTQLEKAPESKETERGSQPQRLTLPEFPKAAWRGLFADYRAAMESATEASDAFHFATLWARCAVAIGRRTRFILGMNVYPNAYLVCFGHTGDRKSTATRYAGDIGSGFKIVSGGGSGEGLADEFSGAEPGQGFLLYAEEFSQILRPGSWEGATLIPFLTQCFDCPARYEMKFRKSPVQVEQPTPTLLAGATPEWFWQDFRVRDFQGGFGNRLFFFAGARKPPVPLPESPNLAAISSAVDALAAIHPCVVYLDDKARGLWETFYRAWDAEESRRDPLQLAAVKRIPSYIIKLAMLYAALEGTLPKITCDQLAASILVGRYGEECAKELLSLQNSGTNPRKELERHILALVRGEPSGTITKREIYKRLWRHYQDAEAFNRAFDSLERAGELFTKREGRGRVWVSREPLD